VVNKADRTGADGLIGELNAMLSLGNGYLRNGNPPKGNLGTTNHGSGNRGNGEVWRPPVLKCIAIENVGIQDVVDSIFQHRDHLRDSGKLAEINRELSRAELMDRLEQMILSERLNQIDWGEFDRLVERIERKKIDAYGAARFLLGKK